MTTERLLTVRDCADALVCSERFVEQLIRRGDLRSLKLGSLRRVRAEDLTKYTAGLVTQQFEERTARLSVFQRKLAGTRSERRSS